MSTLLALAFYVAHKFYEELSHSHIVDNPKHNKSMREMMEQTPYKATYEAHKSQLQRHAQGLNQGLLHLEK